MRSIAALGELTEHSSIREWWTSAPVSVGLAQGQQLRFVLTDENPSPTYSGEITSAIERFLALGEDDHVSALERIYANYTECLAAKDKDVSPLPLEAPADIWQFVTPTEVLVSRRARGDGGIYVTLACECEWAPDGGLQLVYRDGHVLVRVSQQDGHLTDADAANRSSDD